MSVGGWGGKILVSSPMLLLKQRRIVDGNDSSNRLQTKSTSLVLLYRLFLYTMYTKISKIKNTFFLLCVGWNFKILLVDSCFRYFKRCFKIICYISKDYCKLTSVLMLIPNLSNEKFTAYHFYSTRLSLLDFHRNNISARRIL